MAETSIALCGIVKNEVRSIVEWLAHYKALGFTDFIIYDNESSDGTEVILQALDEAGELAYLYWPHAVGRWPQRKAYEHARSTLRPNGWPFSTPTNSWCCSRTRPSVNSCAAFRRTWGRSR